MLTIIRPLNCFIAALSVMVGVHVANGSPVSYAILLAILAGWSLCAGANTHNDICDLDIDRVNRPDRPLPAGKISVRFAAWYAGVWYAVGLLSAGFLSLSHTVVAVGMVIMTIIYNKYLKRRLLLGNLLVGGVSSLAFVIGGLLGDDVLITVVPVGFAILFHFGREVLKDLADVEGDREGGVDSAPMRYGESGARWIVTFTFAVLIGTTIWPYTAGWFGVNYLMVVTVVDAILMYVLWSLWLDCGPGNAARLSSILKADMVIGICAIVVGR